MTDDAREDRRSTLRRRTLLGAVAGSTATLAGCMGDTEFSIVSVDVPTDFDGPLSFDIDAFDRDVLVDSPAAFELSATNDSDDTLELVSMGIRPFGVLELRGETDDYGESWIRLWTDAYEDSDHIDVTPGGMGADGEELVMTFYPGETVTAEYEIRGENVSNSDGTYELGGRLGDDHVVTYRRPDEAAAGNADDESGDESANDDGLPGTGYSPGIAFRIETRSRIPFR
ncbi:hypothetical protein D8Y22_16120 [Salinadaptatus halalkaliphilus]|uniref:DUF8130 domain-containing protein n=1 Tax=Salinadaptatus halalkaliphilus TaxID=2419781 RepID=A0A4S3TIR6_9EURY|nr:hypothetical protein [Salinadaptatus halalkaliphilus]THE63852.1 hypothetical protein D8Y22_16120 [Salinadaptatus halalkaliphilus]